jgi:hypothetical protein
MFFDLLYNLYLKYFSFYEEFRDVSFLYLDLRVKYLLFLSDFNDTRHIFEKHSNNKFYENPSVGPEFRVDGQTWRC